MAGTCIRTCSLEGMMLLFPVRSRNDRFGEEKHEPLFFAILRTFCTYEYIFSTTERLCSTHLTIKVPYHRIRFFNLVTHIQKRIPRRHSFSHVCLPAAAFLHLPLSRSVEETRHTTTRPTDTQKKKTRREKREELIKTTRRERRKGVYLGA